MCRNCNSDFIKLYERLSTLTEAKQDKLNFIDFIIKAGRSKEAAAAELQRFDKLKALLKVPENDYYYWIKNKTYKELFDRLNALEHEQETRKLSKSKIAEGSSLVKETNHWKIYKITTYEAARVVGRDSKWCITGINNYGSRYWDQYTNDGYSFYFIITKGEYDPRGRESKYAFAINDGRRNYEIYDQQDDKVMLDEIPYYEEIEIPGVDLDSYTTDELFSCEGCGTYMPEDEINWDPFGTYPYCETCWEEHFFECQDCGSCFSKDDGYYLGTDNELYCMNCWMDKFFECPQCWETKDLDDAREGLDGEYYCKDCWEEQFAECHDCWDVFYLDDMEEDKHGNYHCKDCLAAEAN